MAKFYPAKQGGEYGLKNPHRYAWADNYTLEKGEQVLLWSASGADWTYIKTDLHRYEYVPTRKGMGDHVLIVQGAPSFSRNAYPCHFKRSVTKQDKAREAEHTTDWRDRLAPGVEPDYMASTWVLPISAHSHRHTFDLYHFQDWFDHNFNRALQEYRRKQLRIVLQQAMLRAELKRRHGVTPSFAPAQTILVKHGNLHLTEDLHRENIVFSVRQGLAEPGTTMVVTHGFISGNLYLGRTTLNDLQHEARCYANTLRAWAKQKGITFNE